MATIDIRLSPKLYLPKTLAHRHCFHSKGFNLVRRGRPQPLFIRRSLAVVCQSKQTESTSQAGQAGKTIEDDFVTRVLKENPSQVEPRYLIGDKFYTLKEKEDLSKNSDVGIFNLMVKLLNLKNKGKKVNGEVRNGSDSKNEAVFLKDILREYRGKLYVPEQVFGTELSEEEEFEKNFQALPKMSIEDFQKAVRNDKVKLLTWKEGTTSVSYGNGYRDFVVELNDIPGDKSLHRTKW